MKRSFQEFVSRLEASGLHDKIEKRALACCHVSLRDLYEGPNRTLSITSARRTVYAWLLTRGKSVNEVARLFDRAPNGVWKMTRTK